MYSKIAVAVLVLVAAAGCVLPGTSSAQAPAKLAENTGILELSVNVKGAEIYVDDALYGMIKRADRVQDVIIPAGKHLLGLKKFGYKSFSASIGVEAGAVNTLAVDLKRLPTEVISPEDMPKDKAKE
ncbi:MAG: PEGA domain-containing protein [Planctomycetes bacterium]|nr:PEGA domain-containing protein [Planctomycetota bacterium]